MNRIYEFNKVIIVANDGKHGSFSIVLSVWNVMLGSNLVTLPWAYQNTGLFMGICTILIH
jgi:hypothetical protein